MSYPDITKLNELLSALRELIKPHSKKFGKFVDRNIQILNELIETADNFSTQSLSVSDRQTLDLIKKNVVNLMKFNLSFSKNILLNKLMIEVYGVTYKETDSRKSFIPSQTKIYDSEKTDDAHISRDEKQHIEQKKELNNKAAREDIDNQRKKYKILKSEILRTTDDYYQILNIPREASDAELKRAIRLMKSEAAKEDNREKMQLASKIEKVLSEDLSLKRLYDKKYKDIVEPSSHEAKTPKKK